LLITRSFNLNYKKDSMDQVDAVFARWRFGVGSKLSDP
jgi:hypothetical protein